MKKAVRASINADIEDISHIREHLERKDLDLSSLQCNIIKRSPINVEPKS